MRTLYVIPAMAVAAAIIAALAGAGAWEAACAAVAAAAVTHAVRTLMSDSPAALAGAILAAQLANVSMLERGLAATSWLALAATAWAVAELARMPKPVDTRHRPAVALVPAIVATIFAPGSAALCAIAGARLVRHRPPPSDSIPTVVADVRSARGRSARIVRVPRRPRWIVLLPVAGVAVALLAIAAGAAHDGALGSLAAHWYGGPAHPLAATSSLAALADGVGPLTAVAALAGLGLLVRAPALLHGKLAILACVAGALLVDLRAGSPTPLTFGLASLCAGVAVGRFAGTIRIASGQTIAAATCGLMLLLPPAWAIIG